MSVWTSKDGQFTFEHTGFKPTEDLLISKSSGTSIVIPASILMDFVAEIVRKNAISKLKQMETDELLTVQINYDVQP